MKKRGRDLGRTIKKHWKRISLKDKSLIVIMIILLWQSGYNLFAGDGGSPHSGSIDVVVRTTSAAIFGYFLSANFLNKKVPQMKRQDKEEKIKEISCICTEIEEEREKGEVDKKEENSTYFVAQVLIAAVIGIVSLLVLIIARDIEAAPVSSISALAQFRDFVSGCIGFLIGVPDTKNTK